jgi:hypothetical protein
MGSTDRLMPRALTYWLAMLVACTGTGSGDASDEHDAAAPLPSTTTPPVPLRLPPAMRDREWISIERTGCYGWCPTFTLTASAAGGVEWLGVEHVQLLGTAYRVVDAKALAEIYAEFARLDWLEIPQRGSGYDEDECRSHAPTTRVTLGRGRVARTLSDYHGCGGEELVRMRSLETRLVELLAAPNWIEPGSDPTAPSIDRCRTMAFRPLFTPYPGAPSTSFSELALSTASRSIHQRSSNTMVHVVAVDDGDAELASSVTALALAVSNHIDGFAAIEARVVAPAPNRPAPGEIRMLVAPDGCPQTEVEGRDGW